MPSWGRFPAFRSCARVADCWRPGTITTTASTTAAATFPRSDASQQVFLDFFRDPPDSERRRRPGVYTSQVFGPAGKRVQIILLDTRYFRSPLKPAPKGDPRGPYLPTDDPTATMLGDTQWGWLASS